jgi:uncharacterized protein Yka (UPF0111/DUF47 family)
MKIDENYTIEKDQYCCTLRYVAKRWDDEKQKEITTTSATYHGTIHQALKTYTDLSMKSCETLQEILDKVKELHSKIDKLKLT